VELVAADIGGNHARFALANVEKGRVTKLNEAVTLRTAEHASLPTAWEMFGERLGRALPRAAAIAVACPIAGDVLKLTNNPWIIRPALIAERLGVDRVTLINDFGAVGHAVVQVGPEHLRHLCGPDRPLPERGVISIIGPGTGLGVAHVLRREGRNHVIECEGGHIDYAPLDDIEDAILARLRQRYRRVSVERIVSGPGLANIYEGLAAIEGRAVQTGDNKTLWTAALAGEDKLAVVALDRFCMVLGSVAGDVALAQGANAVVIAGGLGLRIADLLPRSGFASRFTAKGRFERIMSTIPVKVITHPQPGLFGAAAAFAEEYSE
jgi:glucokinase